MAEPRIRTHVLDLLHGKVFEVRIKGSPTDENLYKIQAFLIEQKVLNPDDTLGSPGDSDGTFYRLSTGNGVIVFWDTTAQSQLDPGLVAHECLHALLYMFQSRDWPADADNDEPLAYSLQYLVSACLSRRTFQITS